MYGMIYKAFKYRIYPNKEQEELILKHMGSSFTFTKNNTAGTAEIHACGDMKDVGLSAQETKPSLVVW